MKFADNWTLPTITLLTFSLSLCGCGGGGDTQTPNQGQDSQQQGESQGQEGDQANAELEGPGATVAEFLRAANAGDDAGTRAMLSRVAREKGSEEAVPFTPRRSDTATFEIGEIEYLGEDGARVGCTMSDMGASGEMIWMVRKDPEGWRIVGTAFEAFPGERPVLLDFENPAEVKRKLQLLGQERMRRRQQGQQGQQGAEREVAETPGNPTVR